MPSTLRRSLRLAARICCGSRKTSSNLRNRTGPTVGNMLSAIQASVAFMGKVAQASRLRLSRTPQAGGSRYLRREFRLRLVLQTPISSAVRWVAGFLPRRFRPEGGLREVAYFRPPRAGGSVFVRSAYRPKCPFAAALRRKPVYPSSSIRWQPLLFVPRG